MNAYYITKEQLEMLKDNVLDSPIPPTNESAAAILVEHYNAVERGYGRELAASAILTPIANVVRVDFIFIGVKEHYAVCYYQTLYPGKIPNIYEQWCIDGLRIKAKKFIELRRLS